MGTTYIRVNSVGSGGTSNKENVFQWYTGGTYAPTSVPTLHAYDNASASSNTNRIFLPLTGGTYSTVSCLMAARSDISMTGAQPASGSRYTATWASDLYTNTLGQGTPGGDAINFLLGDTNYVTLSDTIKAPTNYYHFNLSLITNSSLASSIPSDTSVLFQHVLAVKYTYTDSFTPILRYNTADTSPSWSNFNASADRILHGDSLISSSSPPLFLLGTSASVPKYTPMLFVQQVI